MLVDTSVWIDHFRKGNARLAAQLGRGEVWTHPFVIGELACGHLDRRAEVLDLLHALPRAPMASEAEALGFLARHRLEGRGIGWIDVHLLASAALGRMALWTLDARLERAARRLQLGK